MMFQRAPPDVNGFGVITWTPGLIRSSQVRMFFGLPLRTTRTTSEFVRMPFVGPEFQLASTMSSLTSRVMSVCNEKFTTSAARPLSTARLWSPDAPYDSVNLMLAPCGVFRYSLMIASNAVCGVEYATNDSVTVGFVEPEDAPLELLPQAASATATAVTNVVVVTRREDRGCTGRLLRAECRLLRSTN